MKQVNSIQKTILRNNKQLDILTTINDYYLVISGRKYELVNIQDAYEIFTVTEYNKPKLIKERIIIRDKDELCIYSNNTFKYYKIIRIPTNKYLDRIKEGDIESIKIHLLIRKIKKKQE